MEPTLDLLFHSFSLGDHPMENKQFNKIFKDSDLLGKSLTPTDLDLIFAKNKKKGEKKLDLDHFPSAFDDVAAKLKLTRAQLLLKCRMSPVYTGTKPDHIPLHDNKSLYTGVYAKGGPKTVDSDLDLTPDLSGKGFQPPSMFDNPKANHYSHENNSKINSKPSTPMKEKEK